jgi:predicted nucleotidyltransferase
VRIGAKDVVCGYPVLQVRELLRVSTWGRFGVDSVAAIMEIDHQAAASLLDALESAGYVERVLEQGEVVHRITIKGSALSMASAAPPLKRTLAAKLLVEFLERVEQIRDEPKWCFKVDKVVLFGSFMTNAPTLGDIDLAIALRPAHADREQQRIAEDNRRREADDVGRHFAHYVARLAWPEREVGMFLKGRSRLSFHDPKGDAPVIETGPHATIYENDRVCEESIELLAGWHTPEARDARGHAIDTRRRQALERRAAANSRKLKEMAATRARLEEILAMTDDEREQHREEIIALVRRFEK